MKIFYSKYASGSIAILFLASLMNNVGAAEPTDWSKMPSKTITLFYPGQSSYQWLRSSAHRRVNKNVIAGDSCFSCHEHEENRNKQSQSKYT